MLRENLKIGKIKFLMIAMACGVTFTSCDDAINIDPADEIVESNAITNLDDFQSATIGVYATIGANSDVFWNSLFTDELQLPSSNNGQGIQVHTWSINSDDGTASGLYSSNFTTINRANRVLEAVSNVSISSPEDQATLNKLQGELLAIRAFAHFRALTFFSTSYTDDSALAVPYLDYAVVLEKPARNTVGEVFTGIADDLATAFSLIPATATDNIFMTRNAIIALQARIALYRQDYPTAIAKSSQLISQYPLATIAGYPAVWQDNNDTENIFKLARVQGDGAVGQVFSPSPALIYWIASDKLTAAYDSNDVRLNSFMNPTTRVIAKYPGDISAFGLNDIKVFRISEQYLIRAEAYANSAQPTLAANDLNALRANRIPGATPIVFSGSTDANTQILEERFREFAFEGHRFFDLKRTGMDVNRLDSDCSILDADACDLLNNNYRFTLPIPQSEIFLNPNAVQNPGYNN